MNPGMAAGDTGAVTPERFEADRLDHEREVLRLAAAIERRERFESRQRRVLAGFALAKALDARR